MQTVASPTDRLDNTVQTTRGAAFRRRGAALSWGGIVLLVLLACLVSGLVRAGSLGTPPVRQSNIPATFTLVGGLTPGQPGHLAISWRGKKATELTIWIDFNGDGQWTDDEIIARNRPIEPGIEVIDFSSPSLPLMTHQVTLRVLSDQSDSELTIAVMSSRREYGANGSNGMAWVPGFWTRGLDEVPSALVVFDDGSGPALYAAGDFLAADGVVVNHVAKWDGLRWSSLGSGTNGPVYAMVVYDDGSGPAIFVGGTFSSAGGAGANSVAKWDGSAWSSVGAGLFGDVYALKVFDSGNNKQLIAGGWFYYAGNGNPAKMVASWDGSSWHGLGAGMNASVLSLAEFEFGGENRLYAGGKFTSAGGVNANHIASWNGTTWQPVGAGLNGNVDALAVVDNGINHTLFAGGGFTTAGEVQASNIAKWDGNNWAALGSGVNGHVSALGVWDNGSGQQLFVGGGFNIAGGTPAMWIAKWNGSAWAAIGSGINGAPHAFAAGGVGSGSMLYVGGVFTKAGSSPAVRIASWDGAAWAPVSSRSGNGIGSDVRALLVFDDGDGEALFCGGQFNSAGSISGASIARWDGTTWAPLGSGIEDNVNALEVYDDGNGPQLYAGGSIVKAGGMRVSGVARWDGTSWSALGSGILGTVMALKTFSKGTVSRLYAGGSFWKAGEHDVNNIASWNGHSWSGLGTGVNGTVSCLAVYDGGLGTSLYVGGSFSEVNGMPASNIARWDGYTWTAVGNGVNGTVESLHVYDGGNGPRLIVGGAFTSAGGVSVDRIAAWDGHSWSALTGGGMDGSVVSLTTFDDGSGPALVAGGDFSTAGGVTANGIAKWDGSSWTPLGNGVNLPAIALAPYNDGTGPALFAGGNFTRAGSTISSRIAKWSESCSFQVSLNAGNWQMIGLPCSPTGATVGDIFGDDLPPADYDSRWVMYEWDRSSEQYTKLGLESALNQGVGYWIRTLDAGQTIDVDGRPTDTSCSGSPAFSEVGCFSEPLTGSSTGRWNMIGHPMAYTVNWGDVRFVDDSGNEWTPSEAEAHGVASKDMYTWNGSAYQTWDDVTPGMLGTLGVFEGQWVKAYATATALRIPAMPASGSFPVRAEPSGEGEWLIRLTATSGKLSDPGNVFGHLKDAKLGLDPHDLPELAPFANDYLTIVFPHPEWRTGAWAYTTDFHGTHADAASGGQSRGGPAPPQPMGERWRFEIRSGKAGRKVTLRWQGPAEILRRSMLVDVRSGRHIRPKPGGRYTVEMTAPTRAFTWIVTPDEDGLDNRK